MTKLTTDLEKELHKTIKEIYIVDKHSAFDVRIPRYIKDRIGWLIYAIEKDKENKYYQGFIRSM